MSSPPGVPRALLVLTGVSVVALLAVVAVATPWTVAPTVTDPTAGLSAAQVATAERLRGALLVPVVASTVAAVLAAAWLALSHRGRRLLHRARGPVRGRPLVATALVVLVVLVAVELARLPFGAWAEHLLRDAGLSTRSWYGWARDRGVQAAIEAMVTVPAVVAVVALARAVPRWWPAVVAVGAAALVLVGSAAYPLLVEPAFNDFEPLPAGQLRDDVLWLAAEGGVEVSDVLVSDASHRATTLNAYVSGIGPTRRVVLYDTLLDTTDDGEVLAVVAHELGHVDHRDVLRGTATGALAAAAAVLVLGVGLGRAGLDPRTRGRLPSFVAVLLLATVFAQVVSTPVEALLSRQVERCADRYALSLVPAADFAAAMRLLAVTNLSDPSPPGGVQWWFGSHPTTAERLAAADGRLLP